MGAVFGGSAANEFAWLSGNTDEGASIELADSHGLPIWRLTSDDFCFI